MFVSDVNDFLFVVKIDRIFFSDGEEVTLAIRIRFIEFRVFLKAG